MAITPVTNLYEPGPYNVFVPAAQAQFHVEFSRNPASFALAKYMQLLPVEAVMGLYAELSTTDPITVVSQNENLWPDGQIRPRGRARPLRWKQWRTERRAYGYTLGNLTVDQAKFDIIAAHGRGEAARAMTDRTIDARTVLTTTTNWPASNLFATIAALIGAGSWYTSLVADNYIKKSFNKVKQIIGQQTGGAVQPADIQCLVNPVAAGKMASTDEIISYMKNHEQALAALRGTERAIVDDWGLPPVLYGINMVVENAVVQTTRRLASGLPGTIEYVFPGGTGTAEDKAVFTSRLGGLVSAGIPAGANAAPTFTTLSGLFVEELNVETEVDGWDRLTKGSVVENRDIVLTAPQSGVFIQNIAA